MELELLEEIESKPRLRKLMEAYYAHGKIIVGVDFDDTLFPLDKQWKDLCRAVRAELKTAHPHIILCLYTVSDSQSLEYKRELMNLWGISADYVNDSPVKLGDGSKPFFNLLLDDKAGLEQSLTLLEEFNYVIKKSKK